MLLGSLCIVIKYSILLKCWLPVLGVNFSLESIVLIICIMPDPTNQVYFFRPEASVVVSTAYEIVKE